MIHSCCNDAKGWIDIVNNWNILSCPIIGAISNTWKFRMILFVKVAAVKILLVELLKAAMATHQVISPLFLVNDQPISKEGSLRLPIFIYHYKLSIKKEKKKIIAELVTSPQFGVLAPTIVARQSR